MLTATHPAIRRRERLGPAPQATPAGVPLRRPTHPGRFLERNYLQPLAMTQVEAARRLGISRRRLNELIQGHRGMTPDTAIRCTLLFGWPVSAWLSLQAGWDSYQAWKAARHAGLSRATLHRARVRGEAAMPSSARCA
jgi:addiction module HigA family antidote